MLERAHSPHNDDITNMCRLISILIVYRQIHGEVFGLPVVRGEYYPCLDHYSSFNWEKHYIWFADTKGIRRDEVVRERGAEKDISN
jgi:hypothetical protein